MRYIDVAIIGGGLAGSTAATLLGRTGIATVLIDPQETYPFDFCVEKLSGDAQLERFSGTGIADSALRSATHDGENWIARFGYRIFNVAFGLTAITTRSMQALRAAATGAA